MNPQAREELHGSGLVIKALKSSKEKIDRLVLHPVQPWVAFADRTGAVTIWDYETEEEIYANQLGGSDEGALQEAALRQRAARTAASISGAPPPPNPSPTEEASLAAKSTASGAVNDLAFLDIDSIFWQLARQSALQHEVFDGSTLPAMTRLRDVSGRRWIVAACENKVTLHDIASSHSLDISRSAAFESKAPTRLAFLLLNAPSLLGAAATSSASTAAQLLPIMAVGTSSGSIYLTNPTSAAVFAKLAGGHRGSITALLPFAAADGPMGPDRLLSASSDGSIAIWDPSRTATRGSDREFPPVRTFKAHDSGVRDAAFFLTLDASTTTAPPPSALTAVAGALQTVQARGRHKQDAAADSAADASAVHASAKTGFRLATVGDDRRLAVWETSTWTETMRIQPFPKGVKATCHSLGFAPWGGAGLGLRPSLVMASGEVAAVLGFAPRTGEVTSLMDLAGAIDPGQKKVPKLYHMRVHPTRPHLIAAATNTGVVLLSGDPGERPPVVALPAQVLTLEALMAQSAAAAEPQEKTGDKEPTSRAAQGLTYVLASGGKLWSTAYRMQSRISPSSAAATRTVSLESGPKEALADLDHPGRPTLACSSTGRSISVLWPDRHAYTAYSLAPTGSWQVIDRDAADCLVWASTAPMYAVIVSNQPMTPEPVVQRKGLIGGALNALGIGRQHQQSQGRTNDAPIDTANNPLEHIQGASGQNTAQDPHPASPSPATTFFSSSATATVKVHIVDENSAQRFVAAHQVNLGGARPVCLHGGALLGIVALDPIASQRSLRFFSWRDFSPIGPPLAEPRWVSWEPECTLAALGYDKIVEICRVHPTFQRFATLALPETQAALWQPRQLFVAGPDSVHLVFADPAQDYVHEVALASIAGGVASTTAPALDATPLPPEQLRPAGPITLAGVRHSYLWLADAFGRPFLVSLRHPGLRLRCLAARGELTTARTIAERGLSASFHDDVARFLAAMSPGDGVKEALLLPGLTPSTELALAIRAGDWDRAAMAFQALALGVSDRGLLSLASSAHGGTATGEDAELANSMGLAGLPTTPDRAAAVDAILSEHMKKKKKTTDMMATSNGSTGRRRRQNVPRNARKGAVAAEDDGGTHEEHGGNQETGQEQEQEQEEQMEEGGDGPDAIDWDAPALLLGTLSAQKHAPHASTVSTSRPRISASTTVAAAAVAEVVDPSERRRVCEAAELGLRFADAAADAGHEDAARVALGAMVRFAPGLPASLLRDLVARMGRCRMTESARNLALAAAAARPGSALQEPAVASLLAALTGGSQKDALQATLHAAGLAPLSAVYAAAWGRGDVETALERWHAGLGKGVRISPPKA